MDLVIARVNAAIGPDQEGPVGKTPIRIGGFQPQRSDQQPKAKRLCLLLQGGKRQIVFFGLQHGILPAAAGRDAIGHFGGQDEPRALLGRFCDEVLGDGKVDLRVVSRCQLDQRGLHQAASSASSLPARSNA